MREIEGVIKISARGTGFLNLDGKNQVAEIDSASLNTALPGDTVRVKIGPQINGRISGVVSKIISRKRDLFVGRLEKEKDFYFVEPDNKQIYVDILVARRDLHGARPGDKVLAKITNWTDAKKEPLGKIVQTIGRAGKHETEMEAIVYEQGFAPTFPAEIEAAAEQLKKQARKDLVREIGRRRDLRHLITFTIDPDDAKDFDDALSFRQLPRGEFEVGVHIADVSHYVRPDSTLDKEAVTRATSIYLVDRTIPMLPEVLSNDLCSLNPNEDKLAFSALFRFNRSGEILEQWFGRATIRSKRRFTYEEAQKILETERGDFAVELSALNKLAGKLRQKRIAAGALSFGEDEVRFSLDKQGRPIGVGRKVRAESNSLVEELMLLANRRVAEYATKLSRPQKEAFVYRIHDRPKPDKIGQLAEFVRTLGYPFSTKEVGKSAKALTLLLRSAEGKPEENLIQTAALKTMAKAIYSMKNIGHYGLAFAHYTHFTSPIRRYPDILVHRLLDIYLSKKKPSIALIAEYKNLCAHSSQREQNAQQAEWDSIKYKQAEYLKSRVGQTFQGIISGLAAWGVYVEELSTMAEGLVRISELKDDYYNFDEKNYALVGRRRKKRYHLGDKVKVKLLRADPETRQIDFRFV